MDISNLDSDMAELLEGTPGSYRPRPSVLLRIVRAGRLILRIGVVATFIGLPLYLLGFADEFTQMVVAGLCFVFGVSALLVYQIIVVLDIVLTRRQGLDAESRGPRPSCLLTVASPLLWIVLPNSHLDRDLWFWRNRERLDRLAQQVQAMPDRERRELDGFQVLQPKQGPAILFALRSWYYSYGVAYDPDRQIPERGEFLGMRIGDRCDLSGPWCYWHQR